MKSAYFCAINILIAAMLVSASVKAALPKHGHSEKPAKKQQPLLTKPEVEARIDEFIENVMECRDIPGLSLSVIKDGEVGMYNNIKAIYLCPILAIHNIKVYNL
jgi:CubicO group peptidase (beta-lactamase class C family)